MSGRAIPAVFVTANVGSIFEEPTDMLQIWATEFLSTIARLDPKFVALHCQEVGGKNYEKSMQYVKDFVKLLLESEELRLFDRARIYLDEDFSSVDKFTALGNFYFIHESLTSVLLYDFHSSTFVEINDRQVHSDDIETVTTMEKSKFPLEYFPECKWSRKGFLRTRWNLDGAIFDLVNIHLFHDASNFVAIESFPSEYSETRRHALIYTLDRFQNDEHESVPIFFFGDFNFRTDTQGVVKRLSEGLCRSTSEGETEDATVEYCDNDEKVLCLGKKMFSHLKHQDLFCDQDAKWLKDFDKEFEFFSDQLIEFTITFPPSYPFEEGTTAGKLYMKTRCPAWCDRVLLSKDALSLVKDASNPGRIEYSLMGRNACMGDHKPVYLRIEVTADTAKETVFEMGEVGLLESSTSGHSRESCVDTGQGEPQPNERSGLVKRVNSASLVESHKSSKREDWKNTRCNSDVSWNPVCSQEVLRSNKLRSPLLRGSSKVRLISTSTSINLSLPRLTSHHSSSDEDWFEVVDGEDDVLEMRSVEVEIHELEEEQSAEEITTIPKETECHRQSPISISKRLSQVESHVDKSGSSATFDIQVVDDDGAGEPSNNVPEAKQSSSKKENFFVQKTRLLLRHMRREPALPRKDSDSTKSWETIELSESRSRSKSAIEVTSSGRQGCCVIQ